MKLPKHLFDHKYIFLAIVIICACFLAFIHFSINEKFDYDEVSNNVTVLKDYTIYQGDLSKPLANDDEFKTKDTIILKLLLPDDLKYNSTLGFYAKHQNVSIYYEDDLIYEFKKSNSSTMSGISPGNSYSFISNIYEYRGRELLLYLDNPYGFTKDDIPVLFLGDKADIIMQDAINSSYTFITGLVLFILGFAAIIIWLLFKKGISVGDLTLYYAGIFCILTAIWTVTKQPILSYYLRNTILIYYISTIASMLIPITLILLLRELCKARTHKMWNAILYLNYATLMLTIVCHIFGIVDLYYNLIFSILILSSTFFIALIYSVYITYKHRFNNEGRLDFIGILLLCIGFTLCLYKTNTGNVYEMFIGSILIIMYVLIVLNEYIRRSLAVISKNDKLEFYENLAYRDSLTGLFNRLAYDRAISAVDVSSAAYIIVICDLNNLKYFNDTYGHTIGDTYIKDSASLIKQAFKNLGPVYRIGGDEFCIIMKDKSIFQYETATRQLDTLLYNYNKTSEILKMNIAYGYALYDKKIDHDIYETRNRADAMMYEKKFFMKKNQVTPT